jgi:hypothetical protein
MKGFTRQVRSLARLGLALGLLAAAAGAVTAACPGESPEVVLTCFTQAHAERDIELLERLLAPEYAWVVVVPPEADIFDREASMTASRNMFAAPEVEWVSLEFAGGYLVVEGEVERTWRIEDLKATLTIKHTSAEEPRVASMCATLYVRKTTGENAGYEVYREVFFEGLGCEGE